MTTPIDPKAMELVDKFNQFIKKWCGDKFPHLIDSDENDGESFREAIVCLASQPKPCNDSVGKLSEQYKVLIAKCERFLDSSPKTMKVSREAVRKLISLYFEGAGCEKEATDAIMKLSVASPKPLDESKKEDKLI